MSNTVIENSNNRYHCLSPSQLAILAIWQQVNASLLAYNKLIKAFFDAERAWQASVDEWHALGIHNKHLNRHKDTETTHQFLQSVDTAIKHKDYQLIFSTEEQFPSQLLTLFDPPPLLFVKGNVERLSQAQVAIVGSRKPTPHAQKITFDLAQYIAQSGYVVTSGLAQGVDYQAHIGALTQEDSRIKGRTIGVMGTGINVAYPNHHQSLFKQIIEDGGCLISELLPDTPANKHTFPRRNRIVAGLSMGTIVTEATVQSGSLITARLTSEQGKQVFAIPSHIDNKNAEGCHHLIREGATLIYHPNQVLEDLRYQHSMPSLFQHEQTSIADEAEDMSKKTRDTVETKQSDHSNTKRQSKTPVNTTLELTSDVLNTLPLPKEEVAPHLSDLFAQIDWSGVDVDTLMAKLSLNTQTLLGQLMELELMGLIMQQGGRYVRV